MTTTRKPFDILALDLLRRAKDMLEKMDDPPLTGPFRDEWTSLVYEIEILLAARSA